MRHQERKDALIEVRLARQHCQFRFHSQSFAQAGSLWFQYTQHPHPARKYGERSNDFHFWEMRAQRSPMSGFVDIERVICAEPAAQSVRRLVA